MSYTEVGVVNLALQRLGVKTISALTDTTTEAEAANAVWEYIRDEVLEAGEWNFAKSRTTLSRIPQMLELEAPDGKRITVEADRYIEDIDDISIQLESNTSDALSVTESSNNILIKLANSTSGNNTAALIESGIQALGTVNGVDVSAWTVTANTEWAAEPPTADVDLDAEYMEATAPGETYDYAYLLPSDFLKVAASKRPDDLAVDTTGGYGTFFDDQGMVRQRGLSYSYVIESLSDSRKVLLTDYENTEDDPLELVYIRQETDVTKWTAHFISAVAYRLAAELAYNLTEGDTKFKLMMDAYMMAIRAARGINQSSDYVEHEIGSTEWEYAGW